LSISPTLLGQWQNLAIEGMLKALDPTKKDPLPPINQRLSRLIEKKLSEPGKLEKRLQSIQKQRRPDSRGRLWPSNHRAARRRGSEPR
jgi:hypothetical protein